MEDKLFILPFSADLVILHCYPCKAVPTTAEQISEIPKVEVEREPSV